MLFRADKRGFRALFGDALLKWPDRPTSISSSNVSVFVFWRGGGAGDCVGGRGGVNSRDSSDGDTRTAVS